MIECLNVSKKYGNIPVLEKLSFQIPAKKCYGFLGQNGAGKTTTLRVLAGLLRPDGGEVRIHGHSVVQERSTTQRLCGYLPQSPSFYPWLTGEELLRLSAELMEVPRRQARSSARHYLNIVELEPYAHRRVGKYSGGMQQRLGLAQALISDPEVLLLDEPASDLDPAGREEMFALLTELKKSKTILFSSHILHDVEQVCDGIVIIHQGKILAKGPLTEVLSQASVGAEAVQCQVRFTMPGEQVAKAQEILKPTLAQAGIEIANVSWEESGLEELYRKVVRHDDHLA